MSDASAKSTLKPLHADATLIRTKLNVFERWTSEQLRQSLLPGSSQCLKCRPDGTMLDGHHRVLVLRGRGEDVEALPREIVFPTGKSV